MAKKTEEKRWPTYEDLQSWFLLDKISSTPAHRISPELIKEWIREFKGNAPAKMHRYLHDSFDDFGKQFMPPDAK